jgi:hypothetical protein
MRRMRTLSHSATQSRTYWTFVCHYPQVVFRWSINECMHNPFDYKLRSRPAQPGQAAMDARPRIGAPLRGASNPLGSNHKTRTRSAASQTASALGAPSPPGPTCSVCFAPHQLHRLHVEVIRSRSHGLIRRRSVLRSIAFGLIQTQVAMRSEPQRRPRLPQRGPVRQALRPDLPCERSQVGPDSASKW